MIKVFAAFAALTVMISTASVYNLKQATENLEEKKREISASILKDREAIKVLRAEMAYLSRPERLERLSQRHLVLKATQTAQMETQLDVLSIREGVQMASMPVDNFQPFLPRHKPDPNNFVRVSQPVINSNPVRQARKVETVSEPAQETMSLYDRILAKIGN